MRHGVSVCLFWVERGTCVVLIRRHGGQACRREPMLAGSEHQLSYLASSKCVLTATWRPCYLSRLSLYNRTRQIRFPGSPVPKYEASPPHSREFSLCESVLRSI